MKVVNRVRYWIVDVKVVNELTQDLLLSLFVDQSFN